MLSVQFHCKQPVDEVHITSNFYRGSHTSYQQVTQDGGLVAGQHPRSNCPH